MHTAFPRSPVGDAGSIQQGAPKDEVGDSERESFDEEIDANPDESAESRKLPHPVKFMKCPNAEELREHNRTHTFPILVPALRCRAWR